MNNYDVNASVKCSVTITVGGTATDPTALTFKARNPSGDVTKYAYGTDAELIKDSTGNYHANVVADTPGTWSYRFESTGTGAGASEGQFKVKETAF